MGKARSSARAWRSLILFVLGFGAWLGGVWLIGSKVEATGSISNMGPLFWLDLATFIPFVIGFTLGIQSLLKREPAATLGVAGFALNGIMVFKFLFGVLGLSW